MSALRDKYQSVSQFFKDVKRVIEDIVTRLSDVETTMDNFGGGGIPQEEDPPNYEAGEGIAIENDEISLNYDGPFAVHVHHYNEETPTTMYVQANSGRIMIDQTSVFSTAPAEGVYTALGSGQVMWLKVNFTTMTSITTEYLAAAEDFYTDTQNVIYIRLAKNVDGTLRQYQFGDIKYRRQGVSKLTSTNTSTAAISTQAGYNEGTGPLNLTVYSGSTPTPPTPPVSSGGMMFPNYVNLADTSPYGTVFAEGSSYRIDSAGWLRFTCMGTSITDACVFLHINGNAIGMYKGGGGGFTTFLPIQDNSTVYYTAGGSAIPCLVKFDGYAVPINGGGTSGTI
jgi:hypothetical protein